jgi:hypothetical protein
MLRRAVRVAVMLGVVLAVWTIARPASAAVAPFCDDRGASAIAPPPTLESPNDVIQRVRAASKCASDDGDAFRRTFAPMHRLPQPPGPNVEPTLPRTTPTVAPAEGCVLDLDSPPALVPSGVRFRIERPPRG